MKEPSGVRPLGDIKRTGAGWVTEEEIHWLCDTIAKLSAGAYLALEELSHFPDLAGVQFIGEFNEDGTPRTYAMHPDKLKGVFEALRKQMAETMPAAKSCVEWWYEKARTEDDLLEYEASVRLLKNKLEDCERERFNTVGMCEQLETELFALRK